MYTTIKSQKDAEKFADQLDAEMVDGGQRDIAGFAVKKIRNGYHEVVTPSGMNMNLSFVGLTVFYPLRKRINAWIREQNAKEAETAYILLTDE